jgi:hypothetical protein
VQDAYTVEKWKTNMGVWRWDQRMGWYAGDWKTTGWCRYLTGQPHQNQRGILWSK